MDWLNTMAFHPQGQWLASGQSGTVVFWNLAGRRSLVVRGQKGGGMAVAFTPDGRLLSSSDEGAVRVWSLTPTANEPVRSVWSRKGALLGYSMAADTRGRFAVVANRFLGEVVVVPLDRSPARILSLTRGRGSPVIGWSSVDPSGQQAAVMYAEMGDPDAGSVRIVDLATGHERHLRPSAARGACPETVASIGAAAFPAWLPDGRLVSEGGTGLRLWDLTTGSSRQLRPCRPAMVKSDGVSIRATPDSRAVVILIFPGTGHANAADLSTVDLTTGASRDITSHGTRLLSFALDPKGTTLVTGGADGLVRVGPLSGEEPHLLYGHTRAVTSVAVSPDGKWIASGSDDETIRLWPMPDGPPLHTLPYDELLPKLRSLTNLRVAPDGGSATGYKIELGPFAGWAKAPEW
jgi:WD40 repeat protein